MNNKILVVVDMQPKFQAAACEKTQMRIVEQIRIARENRYPIIVLEYEGGDPEWHDTVDSIMQALHGYDLHVVAEKDEDDGSDVLMWVCGERGWEGTFILTGVNLDACVKRTAEGLARLDKQVEVLGWACNTHSGNYNSPWDSFEDELANIVWREAA